MTPDCGLTVARGIRRLWKLGGPIVHGTVGGEHGLGGRNIGRVSRARRLCRGVDQLADDERVLVLLAGAAGQRGRIGRAA